MEKTTIPHLVLERIEKSIEDFDVPDDVKGVLEKEHDWLMFNEDGPRVMINHKKAFDEVCAEVDKGIEEGQIYFNVEDGTITFYQWRQDAI